MFPMIAIPLGSDNGPREHGGSDYLRLSHRYWDRVLCPNRWPPSTLLRPPECMWLLRSALSRSLKLVRCRLPFRRLSCRPPATPGVARTTLKFGCWYLDAEEVICE